MSQKLIDFVIARNNEQSEAFSDPSERLHRQFYRTQHPTEIAVMKCMDGRLNLAIITKTPPGILQPFRNVGGMFDLGWPFYGELIREWVDYAIARSRPCLVIATYHFSRGETHRGCKGFGYDTEAARKGAENLRAQFERVYGTRKRIVYPIVVGIETDEDVLVFHGEKGEVFVTGDHTKDSGESVEEAITRLYPSMFPEVRRDLLPLILGNIEHVREVRSSHRQPIELDHAEQIIAVGRGFDWLHLPNRALIVGPYDHDWPSAVVTAGGIVLNNLKSGRISERDGALLLISSLSRDEFGSHGWNTAVEKARYVYRVAQKVLHEKVPDLQPHLSTFVGVVDAQTRRMHRLDV
ncbi:MAG TPA: hypothetical protein VMU25_00045 [Candidatus Paceibacterota bacterium]|nr:hypothetical protein [Candidatus Paceibacterota bacterium]